MIIRVNRLRTCYNEEHASLNCWALRVYGQIWISADIIYLAQKRKEEAGQTLLNHADVHQRGFWLATPKEQPADPSNRGKCKRVNK